MAKLASHCKNEYQKSVDIVDVYFQNILKRSIIAVGV